MFSEVWRIHRRCHTRGQPEACDCIGLLGLCFLLYNCQLARKQKGLQHKNISSTATPEKWNESRKIYVVASQIIRTLWFLAQQPLAASFVYVKSKQRHAHETGRVAPKSLTLQTEVSCFVCIELPVVHQIKVVLWAVQDWPNHGTETSNQSMYGLIFAYTMVQIAHVCRCV
jgi:hypothetical protein